MDVIMPRRKGFIAFLVIIVAGCIWVPSMQLVFKKDPGNYRSQEGLSPAARLLAATHLEVWSNTSLRETELGRMRNRNPEWDFMSRTYFVLALANMALRDSEYLDDACEIIDAIIENTLEVESKKGFEHFILSYGHHGGWAVSPARSIFVDGEIALMLAARRIIRENELYRPLLEERIQAMIAQMQKSPVLSAESYPDECWLFCNTVALAAIRVNDALDGSDHSDFLQSWIINAKENLTNPETGILISSYAVNGNPDPSGFGPEGTTIWMASHMLQIVDEAFARDQYARARQHLGRSFLGFGYSREWPVSVEGSVDVDSGPIIPIFGASASASGLAVMAAAAFDDEDYFGDLMTSLRFAGFPVERDDKLRYHASNPVGDAVLLYAMTEGPLWDLVIERLNR